MNGPHFTWPWCTDTPSVKRFPGVLRSDERSLCVEVNASARLAQLRAEGERVCSAQPAQLGVAAAKRGVEGLSAAARRPETPAVGPELQQEKYSVRVKRIPSG